MRYLLALILLSVGAGSAKGAFQEPLIAPRAAAMGGASLATPDDSTAMFLNVAGLGRLEAPEAYMMASKLYAGLDGVASLSKSFMTAGVPTRHGSFGLAIGEFKAAGLMAERTFAVGFARSLGQRLRLGVAGKLLHHGFSPEGDPLAQNDPVFSGGTSKSAFALDLGLMASLTRNLELGFAVRNLNSPDVGLATEDRVPREFRGGLALGFDSVGIKATGELAMRNSPGFGLASSIAPMFGLEKSLLQGLVSFRVGGGPNDLAGGVGLRKGSFGFDYSMSWSRQLSSGHLGTHLLGIRYQFGTPRPRAGPSYSGPSRPLPKALLAGDGGDS
ncbi:MAG: type IX secretion system membrane protein PorP/SprF [Elusimicrobia bacterium]|nr:type IX secretion system membrane protein PorP/SprF [Elusimicrobiota bacterium]